MIDQIKEDDRLWLNGEEDENLRYVGPLRIVSVSNYCKNIEDEVCCCGLPINLDQEYDKAYMWGNMFVYSFEYRFLQKHATKI